MGSRRSCRNVGGVSYAGHMNTGTGLLIKPGMFVSSYAPLFAMLAIRFDDPLLRWVCVGLGCAGVLIVLGCVLGVPLLIGTNPFRVDRVIPAGSEATGYLASYLLPFLTVSKPEPADLAAYGIFFLVAGIVYTRTAVIQVNPMLLILGWRIVRIENAQGLSTYVLTRRTIVAPDNILGSRIASDVIVDRTP